MKTCSTCKQDKPLEAFSLKNKEKGLRQSYCLECQKLKSRAHYQANRSTYIERNKKYPKRHLYAFNTTHAYRDLKRQPCADCGQEFPPCVMEWDHLPEYEKVTDISKIARTVSKKAILEEELKKCELVCANCHRIRTHKRTGGHDRCAHAPVAQSG